MWSSYISPKLSCSVVTCPVVMQPTLMWLITYEVSPQLNFFFFFFFFNEDLRPIYELLCQRSKDLFVEVQGTNRWITAAFFLKDVLCVAVGPRDEGEVIDYVWLECLLGRLSQTLRCRKVEVKKQQKTSWTTLSCRHTHKFVSLPCLTVEFGWMFFLSELRCDKVALHIFILCRCACYLQLAFVDPLFMYDLFLSFSL